MKPFSASLFLLNSTNENYSIKIGFIYLKSTSNHIFCSFILYRSLGLQQALLRLMHIDHHSLEGMGSQAAISAYILDIASAK